jgi:AcrR family transcriptional regulator
VARTVGSNAPETRRRILDSAAESFAAHGYSGASMRDIAEGLGITKAALYYHFASKEDLLDGLVNPVMQSMADFAQAAQSGELTTKQILREFLDLTINGISALVPLMVDPAARSAIKERYDLMELTRRIEVGLAGSSDPECLLRAQFALGGIRSMVISRLVGAARGKCAPGEDAGRRHAWAAPGGGDGDVILDDAARAVVLEAALAGLGAGAASSPAAG